ncbi:hypothetical protein Q0L87_13790, partial [Staphylococcus aureus]|nr:hypothetical protein [Staphylococcus aureus]
IGDGKDVRTHVPPVSRLMLKKRKTVRNFTFIRTKKVFMPSEARSTLAQDDDMAFRIQARHVEPLDFFDAHILRQAADFPLRI